MIGKTQMSVTASINAEWNPELRLDHNGPKRIVSEELPLPPGPRARRSGLSVNRRR